MEEKEKREVEQLRQELASERKRLEDERKILDVERKKQEEVKRQQQEMQRKTLEEREKKDVSELRQKLDDEWKKLEEERKQLEMDKIRHEDEYREIKENMNDPLSSQPKSASTASHVLCAVCGDAANGMHYRALTCEGCKIFFRRNSLRQEALQCSNTENKGGCIMDTHKRRFCAFCRFNKCLEAGMQTGRVWDKERCKTRKPMKKMSTPPPIKVEDDDSDDNMPSTSSAASTTSSVKDELSPEQASLNLLVTTAFQNAMKISQTLPRQTLSTIEELREKKQNEEKLLTDFKGQSCAVSTDSSSHSNKEGISMVTTTCSNKDELKVKDEHVTAKEDSHEDQSGSQSSDDEGKFDEAIHKHIMESILLVLKQMITFIKALPAFDELACEDQASLIKETFVDYLTIIVAAFYDTEQGVFISSVVPGDIFTMSDVKMGGFAEMLKSMVTFSEKLVKMNLTPDEIALLSALCILTPDRPVLSDDAKRKITVHHDRLVDVLCDSGRINHPNQPQFFPQCVSILTELRTHSESFMERMMQLKLKGQLLQPILKEMFEK
ncbi:vitamin D3 receptor B-like [Amphiura filiformis]|uniref:vitamin D3 receptor B-like n=1 Tax=Amphiura filiformis TaxID=82378 RepID=UPI003B22291F